MSRSASPSRAPPRWQPLGSSLQAELADDYIALRGLDRQLAIYRASITYYEQAVRITKQRLQGRIGAALDVARARGQLASTQALLNGAVGNRAVLQHAIAVLVNVDPSSFSIPEAAADG